MKNAIIAGTIAMLTLAVLFMPASAFADTSYLAQGIPTVEEVVSAHGDSDPNSAVDSKHLGYVITGLVVVVTGLAIWMLSRVRRN